MAVKTRDRVEGEIRSLCYAFGYLTAACRGEIEPVLSRQRVAAWLKTKLTPEQVAAGVEAILSRQVYNHLERLAVKEVDCINNQSRRTSRSERKPLRNLRTQRRILTRERLTGSSPRR